MTKSKLSNQFCDQKLICGSNLRQNSKFSNVLCDKRQIFLNQICDQRQLVKPILRQKAKLWSNLCQKTIFKWVLRQKQIFWNQICIKKANFQNNFDTKSRSSCQIYDKKKIFNAAIRQKTFFFK